MTNVFDGGASPHSKRVLLLSGFRIFPAQTGGHIRSAGIARSLARMGHRVLLYSLAGRAADYPPKGSWRQRYRLDELEPRLDEEVNLSLDFGVLQTFSRRFDYPRRWQHAMLSRGWIPGRLRAHLQAADILIGDTPWCPPVPGPWREKPWYLLSHNLEHRLLEQGTPHMRRAAPWMREVEAQVPRRYTDVFACAEEDQSFFRQAAGGERLRLPLVRCGVEPDLYRAPDGARASIRAQLGLSERDRLLVFSGSRFGPNLEALEQLRAFCRSQAEFLRERGVYILAVGSLLSEPVREGAFIGTGRVPEVVPYFAAADAGLNPIVSGSGANVKLFEYMAARLPLVSTRFGVRGTSLEAGADYVEYDPANPLGAVEMLLTQPASEWRARAEQVWQRHQGSCDIAQLMAAAVAQLPPFSG